MSAPLPGLRVVEVAHGVAGPYAGRLLADLGAHVVRVEVGPDPLAARPPLAADGEGALYGFLNSGKHLLPVDADAAADAVVAAAADADVLVEGLGPDGLTRAGVDLGALMERNPRLVVARLSPYGLSGPYRDLPTTPFVLQAGGGWLSNRAPLGQPPVQVGGQLLEMISGAWTAASALAGVRCAGERGGVIDVSMFETAFASLPQTMLMHEMLERRGLSTAGRRFGAPGVQRCRDGWVGINSLTAQHFADICTMMGLPEYAERLQEVVYPGPVSDEFFEAIRPWLAEHDRDDIVELGQAFRVPAVPVCDGQTLTEVPQFVAREFFARRDDGVLVPQRPFRFAATPAHSAADTAPTVEATWTGERRPHLRAPGDLPYTGQRILDLTNFWSGPCLTTFMAALGADVIKIEAQRRPDGFRFTGAFPDMGDDWYERSGSFQTVNLGKRGLALDLSTDDGQAVMIRLLQTADVVVENFAVRVLEQLGLSWELIHEVAPRAILMRLPGYGIEGPWRDHVGWGSSFEQLSGHAWVTGYPDGPPVPPGGYLDPTVGAHAAVALGAALDHRDRTGEGQLVEVSQIEVGAYTSIDQVLTTQLTGTPPVRNGNRSATACPQGVVTCADERWLAVSVRDADWDAFCAVIGLTGALADRAGRRGREDELERALAAWAGARTVADAVADLRAHGIPATEVMFGGGMYDDEQLAARDFYQAMDHPVSGRRRYPGLPMRFWFAAPVRFARTAPTIGQHNREILGDELGLDAAELDRLERAGVIGTGMRT